MRLYVDLDSRQIVTSLGVRQPVSAVYLTRGDSPDLEVQFSQNGVVVDPNPDSLFLCIKPVGVYDGTALVLTTDFTKTGTGASAYWTCRPNLNTPTLDAALGVGGSPDLASLSTNLEIGFITASRQTTTRATLCVIENDLYREGEVSPVVYPTPANIVYYPEINNLQGADSTGLGSLATVTLPLGSVVKIRTANPYALDNGVTGPNLYEGPGAGFQTYVLEQRSNTGAGFVRPNDFNPTTNVKTWRLQNVVASTVETSVLQFGPAYEIPPAQINHTAGAGLTYNTQELGSAHFFICDGSSSTQITGNGVTTYSLTTDYIYSTGSPVGVGTPAISMFLSALLDGTGNPSVAWNARLLFDSLNAESLRWASRELIDGFGNPSANWTQRELFYGNAATCLNWDQGLLVAAEGQTAVDWKFRELRNAAGQTVLNWGTSGPIASQAYVDALVQGLDPKASARAATTANITLSGTQTIDGVSVVAGNRVLVKNQSTPAQNGIYVVAAGAWARATDMDNWLEVPGSYLFIEEGTTNADTAWVCTSNAGGTLGTTAITFVQFGVSIADGNRGDITVSGAGATWTINANAVTLGDLAQVATATFLGRTTAGTGDVEALNATQATALLNTFTSSLRGLVPASGGGTTNFLRADGTWAAAGLVNLVESVNTAAPNTTVHVVQLLPTNVSTNVDLALTPRGTGAIVAQVPDNGTAGGSKRGTGAVDLQLSRSAASQVASGVNSFAAGQNNTASGSSSVAIGTSNTASGSTSVALGSSNVANGSSSVALGAQAATKFRQGCLAMSSGQFSASGDAQTNMMTLRASVGAATAATTELTATGGAVSGTTTTTNNVLSLPSNTVLTGRALITVTNSTGTQISRYERQFSITSAGTVTQTTIGTDENGITGVSFPGLDYSATTCPRLRVQVTTTAASPAIRAVASIWFTEITF